MGARTARTAIFHALVERLSGWVGGNHDNVRLVFVAFQGAMAMKRDTLITVLLVMAGIVLAFVLFGAGVWWKSKTVRRAFLSFDNQRRGTVGPGRILERNGSSARQFRLKRRLL